MDLRYIRGPDNLPEMIQKGRVNGKHIIEGQRGETYYLLIIDSATR